MTSTRGKIEIKRAVMDGRTVKFAYYVDGNLWYLTEFDELFPVPISDVGNATFNDRDKAILFMRYMRAHNKSLENSD